MKLQNVNDQLGAWARKWAIQFQSDVDQNEYILKGTFFKILKK